LVEWDLAKCKERIAVYSRSLGLDLEACCLQRLAQFVRLVLQYRDRAQLTAFRDWESLVEGLLVDSLALGVSEGFADIGELLDIGAGAGFPSVPLALVWPSKKWVAVERMRRKAAFLRIVARRLGLGNYDVVCQELCEWARACGRAGRFGMVVARGVRLNKRVYVAIKGLLLSSGRVALYRHQRNSSRIVLFGSWEPESPEDRRIEVFGLGRDIWLSYEPLERLFEGASGWGST